VYAFVQISIKTAADVLTKREDRRVDAAQYLKEHDIQGLFDVGSTNCVLSLTCPIAAALHTIDLRATSRPESVPRRTTSRFADSKARGTLASLACQPNVFASFQNDYSALSLIDSKEIDVLFKHLDHANLGRVSAPIIAQGACSHRSHAEPGVTYSADRSSRATSNRSQEHANFLARRIPKTSGACSSTMSGL